MAKTENYFIAKTYTQGKKGFRVYDPVMGSYPTHRPSFPYEALGIDREKGLPFFESQSDCDAMAEALTRYYAGLPVEWKDPAPKNAASLEEGEADLMALLDAVKGEEK